MNARFGITAIVLALGALAGAMRFGLDGPAASAAQPQVQGQDTSTQDDQTELALTVYNSDLALVRDVRNIQLPRGTFDLRFMDIAATVNPATVHIRSLTEPGSLDGGGYQLQRGTVGRQVRGKATLVPQSGGETLLPQHGLQGLVDPGALLQGLPERGGPEDRPDRLRRPHREDLESGLRQYRHRQAPEY